MISKYKDIRKRVSNYELLRVISIFMVIILHCLGGCGKILRNIEVWSLNFYGAVFFESFSIIAVNCFVFIAGYFQIKKDKVNTEKLIQLFMLTVVWYVNTYIILIIFSPYINKFLISLNNKQYRKLLILLISIFSIIPTFLPISYNNDKGYGIVTFILIYSIAGYIRLFKDEFNKDKKNYLFKWFLCSLTVFMLSLLSYKLINCSNAWGYNNIFNILSAMYLFLYFRNIKIQSEIINYLATFSFSIYIIHINPSIKNLIYYNSAFLLE